MRIFKIMKRFLLLLGVIIISFVVGINIPVVSVNHKSSTNDYSNWMSETLDSEMLIVDVKLLGAHDAFSSEIDIFSKVDVLSAPGIMTSDIGVLIKGFSVRQSITQIASPNELLSNGIRYFDVRLTYDSEEWMTKHNYISSDFNDIALEITTFLDANQGEFLVLDFQHIHGVDYSSDDDYDLFMNMLVDTGLYNYSYLSSIKDLKDITYSDITYSDITNDGIESRVIIIDKFEKSEKETFNYETSIRSSWANSDNFDDVISFLENERELVSNDPDIEGFVVMQAVTTMDMSITGIANSFMTWSLIERSEKFNLYLIEYNQFNQLLETLPIIMVDYANSSPFIDDVMNIIIEANEE